MKMKKIMFALATVVVAGMVQAAAITWGTGTGIKGVASDSDPTFGGSNAAAGTLSVYVWLVDVATYGSTSVDSIWGKYGSKLDSATASVTGKSGAAGATAKTDGLSYSPDAATPYYGLVLTGLDTDKDGKLDYYIANKAATEINTAGTQASVLNLAKSVEGVGVKGWTAATSPVTPPVTPDVPEPTSGLLALVGLAGLALRRRRA